MQIERGFRGKLDDFLDVTKSLSVKLTATGNAVYDSCCFGVDINEKLSDEMKKSAIERIKSFYKSEEGYKAEDDKITLTFSGKTFEVGSTYKVEYALWNMTGLAPVAESVIFNVVDATA